MSALKRNPYGQASCRLQKKCVATISNIDTSRRSSKCQSRICDEDFFFSSLVLFILPYYSELGEISPAMFRRIHVPKSAASTPCDSRNMIFAYAASSVMSPDPIAPARAIASPVS